MFYNAIIRTFELLRTQILVLHRGQKTENREPRTETEIESQKNREIRDRDRDRDRKFFVFLHKVF